MHGSAIKPEPRRLIDWVLAAYPDTPKTRAKQWILAGRVSVAGKIIRKPHQTVADPGAKLELLDRRAVALESRSGWQIHPRLSLLYLDSSLAVVNKGPGLISVPAPNARQSALTILQDFLARGPRSHSLDGSALSLPQTYRQLRLLPVHRLDQYTSGLFCMACNPAARRNLIEQLKAHSMKREYLAFVQGRPRDAQGTWRHWLELSEDQWRQQVITEPRNATAARGRQAVTHYQVIAEYRLAADKGYAAKLRLDLETGLKHQIRLQAAEAGLPLIGDRRYNKPAPGSRLIDFPRQALHAEKLSVEHPGHRDRRMSWKADLPKDLQELEAALERNRL